MRTRSAIALGASLLALTIPAAAGAEPLAGIPAGLGSTEVSAKVEAKVPVKVHVPVKLPGKGSIGGQLHQSNGAKTNVQARGLDVRQRTEVRNDTRLDARAKVNSRLVNANARVKARVHAHVGGDVVRRSGGLTLVKASGRRGQAEAKRLVNRVGKRAAHRPRGVARQARSTHGWAPVHHVEKPLAAIGRQVGSSLQPGLAGGILLGLAALAGSLMRPAVRRALR